MSKTRPRFMLVIRPLIRTVETLLGPDDLQTLYGLIDTDVVERVVRMKGLPNCTLWVDEMGWLRAPPRGKFGLRLNEGIRIFAGTAVLVLASNVTIDQARERVYFEGQIL